MVQAEGQCVAHRSLALGFHFAQALLELRHIAGELLRNKCRLIEGDYEDFVVGVGRLHHGDSGGIHPIPFVKHAGAGVDHQTERYRNIFLAEDLDLLFPIVFIDRKCALWKTFHDIVPLCRRPKRSATQGRNRCERWLPERSCAWMSVVSVTRRARGAVPCLADFARFVPTVVYLPLRHEAHGGQHHAECALVAGSGEGLVHPDLHARALQWFGRFRGCTVRGPDRCARATSRPSSRSVTSRALALGGM